jgi:hypothetical protein
MAPPLTGKGEPTIGFNAPDVWSMASPVTSLVPAFEMYRNLPVGSTVPAKGAVPAAKGEPATGVNAPLLALMVNAETLPELLLTT